MKTTATGEFHRVALWTFILFMVIGTMIAGGSVLFGKLGVTQVKWLCSVFSIAGCSLFCMACGAFGEKRKQDGAWAMLLAVAMLIGSLLMILMGIWGKRHSDGFWKATILISTWGGLLTLMLILLIADLKKNHQWIFYIAGILIGALGVMITLAVSEVCLVETETFGRTILFLVILVLLATVVIPVMSRIDMDDLDDMDELPQSSASIETLSLTKCPDGTWSDISGKRYTLHETHTPDPPEKTDLEK